MVKALALLVALPLLTGAALPARKTETALGAGKDPLRHITGADVNGLLDHGAGWVNARTHGTDEAALAAALSAAAGKELLIGSTYVVNTGGLVIPDGTTVRFLGKNAKIDYRGTGAAFEIRNSKNIAIHDLNVDLTNAGANAVGLWVRGAWFLQLYKPRVKGGAATHTGILLETSQTGGDNWGAYLVEIHNPDLTGPGLYGIRTRRTAGDGAYDVTHLNVYAGWSKDFDYGLHYRNVSGFQVHGFVADSGVDGYNIDESYDGFIVPPGELGPNSAYGINWGSGCQAMKLVVGNQAGNGGALGYQNNTSYTPETWDQGRMRLYGSRSDQGYYAELKSAFSYAESFNLAAKGGGPEVKLLKWGDGSGLEIAGGGFGILPRSPVYFEGTHPAASEKLHFKDIGNVDTSLYIQDGALRFRDESAGADRFSLGAADGQIEIFGAGQGLYLKSPNGTRYRITVSDAGALEVNAAP